MQICKWTWILCSWARTMEALTPTQIVCQNNFLLRNQAAKLQDPWLTRESFWLKQGSASSEAKVHGHTNEYDETKLVLRSRRTRKGGIFPCHISVYFLFVESNNCWEHSTCLLLWKALQKTWRRKGRGQTCVGPYMLCLQSVYFINSYKLITLSTYIRKQERIKINELSIQLKKLEEGQIKYPEGKQKKGIGKDKGRRS